MAAKAIFIGGTASNVGKSWMTTALCRLLYRRGIRVAPFKAQNMSNNSYPCVDGGEIGRSQVTQARACGLLPESAMNPVLLKPCGESRSQVIVRGKVWKTLDARDYYEQVPYLRQQALGSFTELSQRFDVVVLEGAGSVAELNLAGRDFVNLSMACDVHARALLVADIERGGVFASIVGTLDLLPPAHRELVQSFAVNRFRGDRSLFADGVEILERRSGIPCLGVFPFADAIRLDAEDSLSDTPAHSALPLIAILRFPRISNTTDFQLLGGAVWVERPVDKQFDSVILPGTKSTLADLAWLRASGLADWILAQHRGGANVIGICGGYQMLGESIADSLGVDGLAGEHAGLGLLPAKTRMFPDKVTRLRRAHMAGGAAFDAYEIHMGQTELDGEFAPFTTLEDGSRDGVRYGRLTGTYLHGALEAPAVCAELLGVTGPFGSRETLLDALAGWLESNASARVLEQLIS